MSSFASSLPLLEVQELQLHQIGDHLVEFPRLYDLLEPFYRNYPEQDREAIIDDCLAINWMLKVMMAYRLPLSGT